MKYTGKLLLLLHFIFSTTLFAQTVRWSLPLTDNKKLPYMNILGSDDEGNFYVLRSNISLDNTRERSGFRNRTYQLQYFSEALTLIWEKNLQTSYEDGHITDVKMVNGKIIVTSYISDRKSKFYNFYTQYYGQSGKWDGMPVLLDSFPAEKFDEDNKPGLIVSHDQTSLAFSYRKVNKEETIQYYEVIVIDTNLAVLYKKEIEVPVSTELFVPIDFSLTDQKSFFVLGIHFTTEKKIKSPDQSYYELYGYNLSNDKLINTRIRSENRFLTDVGMSTDNINHNIIVAGFFSDKTMYSTAGVFYYSLNEDSLRETQIINTPFSADYLQRFMGEKKENRELVNYSIDRLIVRKDGGVALVAESMYQTTRSYFDYYMQSYVSHYYYHFGNIMALSVNPDGNILWNNVISKDQNSVDDAGFFSSYIGAVTGSRFATIYNKYIEDDSSVLISFIDADGAQKTDVLFNEEEKVTILPQSGRQIDNETLIVPAYKQNKLYFLEISF